MRNFPMGPEMFRNVEQNGTDRFIKDTGKMN
jgi:hypothetical protein